MTLSGSTSVPNRVLATSATTRRRSSWLPSVDIVADVPMHCRLVARHASRTRRTSNATSAPWRPR